MTIYRFGYTMSLSILHRAMGIVLSVGLLVFAAWLCAAASGETAYRNFQALLPVPLIKAGLALLVVAFIYHLVNGVRHLFWDLSWGMERAQARRSGALVVVVTMITSALLLWVFPGVFVW
jgi:succinate dehydrogenase / fumarate reductase cytochrome b subunit